MSDRLDLDRRQVGRLAIRLTGSCRVSGNCAVEARMETSDHGGLRLIGALVDGVQDFILATSDGRLTAPVRLSLMNVSTSAHRIGGHKVVVDWSRSTVARGRSRVSLSRTELRLLAALIDGSGRAMRRGELSAAVWPGRGAMSGERENALAVYVCSLRKRLSVIGLRSALTTIRRTGYRLSER